MMFRSKTLIEYRRWNKRFEIFKNIRNGLSVGLTKYQDKDKCDTTGTNYKEIAKGDSGTYKPPLTIKTVNPCIKSMEYAVRGPLPIRANEIEKELRAGVKKPFDSVIKCNIGDCQAMGQKPITFLRQVLALACYEPLFDNPDIACDAKNRAQEFLNGCAGNSIGSYSPSSGLEVVRKQVAQFIEKRDGLPCELKDIFLTTGGTHAIKTMLDLLSNDTEPKPTGAMCSVPTYPLYSAAMTKLKIHQIDYPLNEEHDWTIDISEMEDAIKHAKGVCTPKAIIVINPGNPTGQVISKEKLEDIVKFSYNHNLLVIADEVYQEDVYEGEFISLKKTMHNLGTPYNQIQMVSLNSISKGITGECGFRGGYMELQNIEDDVNAVTNKLFATSLGPPTAGQCLMFAATKPPTESEPSYGLYTKEKEKILCDLATKAKMATEIFNQIEGVSCNKIQGAMYAFPQLCLPKKAIEKAASKKMNPDVFYAFELLENTGVCIVPGSGFGQKEGTYHFRTTILPQVEQFKLMLDRYKKFHENFMKEYK